MQREEAVQCGVVGGEAAEQPDLDRLADQRDGAEQAGDDLRAPEAHLAPGKDVTHEGGRHHEQEDHDAQQPDHLARGLVRGVEEAAEDVDVDDDEEETGAVGVRIAHQPAPVDVAHDVLGRREGDLRVRRIVHGEHDAGDDLHHEEHTGEHAEVPEIGQVARNRVAGTDSVIDEARKRQLLVEEAGEAVARLVFACPGKAHDLVSRLLAQPTWMTVSEVNSYSGTSRLVGAGPLRMRPAVS